MGKFQNIHFLSLLAGKMLQPCLTFQVMTLKTHDKGKAGSRDDMGEPPVTTYHHKFMGTVDYIWYICSV